MFKLDISFLDDLHESYLNRENPEGKAHLGTELNLDLLSLSLEKFIINGLAGLESGLTDYKLLDYYGIKIKMPKKGFSRQTLQRLFNPIPTYSPPPGVLIDLLCSYTYGFRYEECVSKGYITDNLAGYQALKNKWQDIPDGRISQDTARTNQSNLNTDEESPAPIIRQSNKLADRDHSEKNFGYRHGRFPKHLTKYLIGSSVILCLIFFYFITKKSDLNNYKVFEPEINTSPFNKKEPPDGRDCPTLSIGNHTTKIGVRNGPSGCWTLYSVSARAGDDINLSIYYHNSSSSAATNVRVKVIKYKDITSKNFRFQVKFQCDQGELVSKPVELMLDSPNSIFFDHVSWYVQGNKTALFENSNGAEIIEGPGLSLGNIGTDIRNNSQGNIIVAFGVNGG